jgi:hypothetical protein
MDKWRATMSQATSTTSTVRVVCDDCGSARIVREDEDPEEVIQDHKDLGCDGAELEEVDPDE